MAEIFSFSAGLSFKAW